MKITPSMVDEVERLLAEGVVSQRKIAKLVGMSRGTVNNIAMGRRPRISAPMDEFEPQRGPLVRCPGCGGKVYLPCLLCHVRRINAKDAELQKLASRDACPCGPQPAQSPSRSCHKAGKHSGAIHARGGATAAADRTTLLTVSKPDLALSPAASSFTPAACREPAEDFSPATASATFADTL